MKQPALFTFCLVLHTCLAAQYAATGDKLHFGATFQGGLLAGSSDNSGVLQALTGIRYRTWSAGIGAGIDYYYERSIPLFLEVKKNLFRKPVTPYLYAGGGLNLPWLKKEPDKQDWMVVNTKGGYYYEAGIGYEAPLFKRSRLLFSAGYSGKSFEQTVNVMPWRSIWPPPASALETFNYDMRRISVKAGVRF